MIQVLSSANGDIYIGRDEQYGSDYAYGGTRMVAPTSTEEEIKRELSRLMYHESGIKNMLINRAISQGALNTIDKGRLPDNFLESRVSGGRCIIKPKNQNISEVITNPSNKDFQQALMPIFKCIGEYLNRNKGKIKLTPDFGRYSGLADMLYQYTQHSLGIRCEKGGCGGKSSYSTSGIQSAFETLHLHEKTDWPITLIGSAGAMGSEFLKYVDQLSFKDVAVCDLYYDQVSQCGVSGNKTILPSEKGKFTDACLKRGGIIVATTVGYELENSNWEIIPTGTILLLAHNLAVPDGYEGLELMEKIHDKGILAIPGQILTLGGALTSRLEWYWRTSGNQNGFDKPLAHKVVSLVVSKLVHEIIALSRTKNISPYEAMWKYLVL